jgi:hypothetical protein
MFGVLRRLHAVKDRFGMKANDARKERLKLQREIGPTMCSGWPHYCLCSKHREEIMSRYEVALRANPKHANELRTEITRQAKALAKRT